MSGTVPPIPPPLGTNSGNAASPNRVDPIPVDLIKIQWSHNDRRLANQDKRLKSILISCLPNDVMKSVIKYTTTQSMWNDLILANEGPSDTRDTKIAALRLKFNDFQALEGEKVQGTYTRLKILLNDLENKGVSIPQAEVNAMFVNSLPRKWLMAGDGITGIKRRHRNLSSDAIRNLAMTLGCGRLKADLESSMWRWR
ncbi:hypothetical protein Tco_1066169 [Tanacetum coccineum]